MAYKKFRAKFILNVRVLKARSRNKTRASVISTSIFRIVITITVRKDIKTMRTQKEEIKTVVFQTCD